MTTNPPASRRVPAPHRVVAMTDLEFRQHQVARWREINWIAMWRLIGAFYAMEIC